MRYVCLMLLIVIGLMGCSGGNGSSANNLPATKTLKTIEVVPKDNKIAVGAKRQFSLLYTYSDDTTQELATGMTWSSSNKAVADFLGNHGEITAISPGETDVTATTTDDSGQPVSFKTTLKVSPLLASLVIDPVSPSIAIHSTLQFKATGFNTDGTTVDLTTSVTWTSSSGSIAAIDTNGKATAVSAGQTDITATLGEISVKTVLNVSSAVLTSIAVTPAAQKLAVATSQPFKALGTFSDNSQQDITAQVAWSSSTPGVATITQDGIATAVAAGLTTITAALESISGTTTLEVTPATMKSIVVTPGNTSVPAGISRQFKAIGTLTDNTEQDLTASATWSSSSPAVAVVDAGGKADAVAEGVTTITATSGGISGSTSLTVAPADLSGTWIGTYTIYDDPLEPAEIGTYSFQFVLAQNGEIITGTPTLRGVTTGSLTGSITGRQFKFTFTYLSPKHSLTMDDVGTAEISGTVMTGHVIENYRESYNCSYTLSLVKQP